MVPLGHLAMPTPSFNTFFNTPPSWNFRNFFQHFFWLIFQISHLQRSNVDIAIIRSRRHFGELLERLKLKIKKNILNFQRFLEENSWIFEKSTKIRRSWASTLVSTSDRKVANSKNERESNTKWRGKKQRKFLEREQWSLHCLARNLRKSRLLPFATFDRLYFYRFFIFFLGNEPPRRSGHEGHKWPGRLRCAPPSNGSQRPGKS